MSSGNIASPDLLWLLVRKQNSFIRKQPGAGRIFTSEKANLKGIHGAKYSAAANHHTIDISAKESGKGVVVSWREEGASPFAVKSAVKSKGVSKVGANAARAVGRIIPSTGREDLGKLAIARTSHILATQKERPAQRQPLASTAPGAWHLPLVGLVPPSNLTSSSPAQHARFQSTGERESVLVLATEGGVLAGVQPSDGELMWRRSYKVFEGSISHVAAGQSAILAWTAPSAADLNAVSATTGKLLWQLDEEEDPCKGEPARVAVVEQEEEVVVECGGLARRLRLDNGTVASSVQAAASTGTSVFEGYGFAYFGLSSPSSVTLELLPGSEELLTVSAKPPSDPSLSLAISRSQEPSTAAALVWIEGGKVEGVVSTPMKGLKQLASVKLPFKGERIVDVGLGERGAFVVMDEGNTKAAILALDEEGKLQPCGTFSVDPNGPALSSYSDPSGGLHIASLSFSRILQLASLEIWSTEKGSTQGMMSAHSFPLKQEEYVGMRGFALQVLPLRSSSSQSVAPALSRFAITIASGAVQLWQGDEVKWTREEGLSTAETGPVAVRELLLEQGSDVSAVADLPTYLLASSTTRTIYGLSTKDETFVVDWKAFIPSSVLSSPAFSFKWLRLGSAKTVDGEVVLRAVALVGKMYESHVPVRCVGFGDEEDEVKHLPVEMEGEGVETFYFNLRDGGRAEEARVVEVEKSEEEREKEVAAPPAWTFRLPAGETLKHVGAQIPASSLPSTSPHSSLSLLTVLSSSSTLTLLDATTGALLLQVPEVETAQVAWDESAKGWRMVVGWKGKEEEGRGETRVRVYRISPGSGKQPLAPSNLKVTVVEHSLPGSLTPVGLSVTNLRLAAPALLYIDRLNRLLAMPLRYLEALAVGKAPAQGAGSGLPWVLSGVRELLPSSHFSLGLSTLPSSSPTRESQSLVFLHASPDLFLSLFTPSRSFDQLSEAFNKGQLGVVVGVLGVALVGTREWARRVRRRGKWEE
ncbi:hypothetical protein JCM8547_001427 [Rhodosporidiobolus lusitaniae]